MCNFFHQFLLVAAPPCQVPCEDSGVNAGFKASFTYESWWVGGYGGMVSDGGRRSLCLLALARWGDGLANVYVYIWGCV